MKKLLLAGFIALTCAPAWADTTSYTLSSSWQKVASSGANVVVFYNNSATFTTSTGAPGVTGGFQTPVGQCLVLAQDLYAIGSGGLTVTTGVSCSGNTVSVSSIPTATATLTQTRVTLTAATSTALIAANSSRKSIRWMNTGTNPMTCVPGTGPAVAGTGMNYDPSSLSTSVNQGGGTNFNGEPVPTNAFTCISTGGTTATVWEGN